MIRFAWLQFRTQAAVVFGGLVVVAIILAVTGPHLVHLYDTTVATCATHGDCSTAASSFLQNDRTLQILLDAVVVVVPGIIGVFWGAPLVARELETRHLPAGLDAERHPHPLACRETWRGRVGQHGRRPGS